MSQIYLDHLLFEQHLPKFVDDPLESIGEQNLMMADSLISEEDLEVRVAVQPKIAEVKYFDETHRAKTLTLNEICKLEQQNSEAIKL